MALMNDLPIGTFVRHISTGRIYEIKQRRITQQREFHAYLVDRYVGQDYDCELIYQGRLPFWEIVK